MHWWDEKSKYRTEIYKIQRDRQQPNEKPSVY